MRFFALGFIFTAVLSIATITAKPAEAACLELQENGSNAWWQTAQPPWPLGLLRFYSVKTTLRWIELPPGCVHHSDRGSQYAAKAYRRDYLADHRIEGSMGRRGNPYDNAKAESFMKTLKVKGIYPMAFETLADVFESIPQFIDDVYNARRLHSALGYISPVQSERQHTRQTVNSVI
jgi:putative transposase